MRFLSVFLLFFFTIIYNPLIAQKYSWAGHFNPTTAILAEGKVITNDASGNIYVAGSFQGTVDFDPGPAVYNLSTSGGISTDAFICKLDAAGNFVWAVRMGGLGTTSLFAMTVGSDGYIYSTGGFNGNNIDLDPGAGVVNFSTAGSSDIFISKLSPSGAYIWAKTIGSSSIDESRGIVVDDNNNVYVTGDNNGTIDMDPGPGTVFFISQNGNGFVLKLDQFGLYVNAYSINSPGLDIPYGMVLKNGFLYAVTYMNITATITKLDLNLNLVWQKATQGGNVFPKAIAVDDAGNATITGSFSGIADFDPGTGTATYTAGGSADMFISKLDEYGNFMWARITPGSSAALVFSNGLSCDEDGNIYVAGKFGAPYSFQPGNPDAFLTSQNSDIFVEKLNYSGAFQWVIKMGGANNDVGNSVYVDGNDNVFSTGYFINSADFNPDPAVSNTLTSFAGAGAVFVSKLSRSNHISGNVFIDANSDGIRQPGEAAFPYRMVKAQNNALLYYGISGEDGQYDMYVDTGTYSISLAAVPPYHVLTGPAQTASFNTSIGGYDSLNNFPVNIIPNINDLSVNVFCSGRPRPGSNITATVMYRNTGTTTLSGSVTLQHAPALVHQQSIPAATTYLNPLLTWNFINLKPQESKQINISFLVPTTLLAGTVLNNAAAIYPIINDTTPADNQDSATNIVVGSYDPNDKTVVPGGPVTTSFISADSTYLNYIVRFQNTGTDTAFNVIIEDTLQSTLDIGSVKILGASHPFSVDIENGNMLKFTFRNILLPDSTTNEQLSHGFVAYRVKPLTTLQAGSTVKNKAAIIFDYNSAVITNETVTDIINVLPVTLTAFNVSIIAGCQKVLLNWSTETETNNLFFTIEKSHDALTWKPVAVINGAINSGTTKHYSYTDIISVTGTVYYRLKQTNVNGTSTNSFTQKVNCNANNQFVKMYPNPVSNKLVIETGKSFTYFLYDINGGLVKTGISQNGITTIEVSGLTKAAYLVKIKSAEGISYHKILIQ